MQNKLIQSINPCTGEILAQTECALQDDVMSAVLEARKAQPDWWHGGFKSRALFLQRLKDIILAQLDDLAFTISKESGKPLCEAMTHDVMPVLDLINFLTAQTEKILKPKKINLGRWKFMGHRSYICYEPHGVVGIISPWNFPFSITVGNTLMALMAGNVVVLKPSEHSLLVAQSIQNLFVKAGFPKRVFSMVTGDGSTGEHLVKVPCDKILFTGSFATGQKIMAACAESLTPVNLELGGKDPFIVFEDADLDLASSAAVWGAFCNCGQVCASVERVYVHQSVAERFVNLVITKTQRLRLGQGTLLNTDVGPLSHAFQWDKVTQQLAQAQKEGARILTGGKTRPDLGALFFEPTVLDHVTHQMDIMRSETFGPVLPIMTFSDDAEVVSLANDSDYALNAYVWTRNRNKAEKIAHQLVAGTVNINDSVLTHAFPQTPWGGPKKSSLGRTHGAVGLMDLVRVKHIHRNAWPSKKLFFWWYPYSEEKNVFFQKLAVVFFGRGLQRFKATLQTCKNLHKILFK